MLSNLDYSAAGHNFMVSLVSKELKWWLRSYLILLFHICWYTKVLEI